MSTAIGDIELVPVGHLRSGNVAATHHDPKTNRLTVRFHSGSIYRYPCTAEQHKALLAAPSIGGHLYRNFIKGMPAAEKLAA
jgi:hypothetical protein